MISPLSHSFSRSFSPSSLSLSFSLSPCLCLFSLSKWMALQSPQGASWPASTKVWVGRKYSVHHGPFDLVSTRTGIRPINYLDFYRRFQQHTTSVTAKWLQSLQDTVFVVTDVGPTSTLSLVQLLAALCCMKSNLKYVCVLRKAWKS